MIKTQPDLQLAACLLAMRNVDALARKMLGSRKAHDKAEWTAVRQWLANAGLVDQGITR